MMQQELRVGMTQLVKHGPGESNLPRAFIMPSSTRQEAIKPVSQGGRVLVEAHRKERLKSHLRGHQSPARYVAVCPGREPGYQLVKRIGQEANSLTVPVLYTSLYSPVISTLWVISISPTYSY
jgi:hypothetical protein